MAQTLEERIANLEAELARLHRKPVARVSAYNAAAQNCKAYFEAVKTEEQHYGARFCCEDSARSAFREKHCPEREKHTGPTQYILTEEDGAEYFALFKEFLAVYQKYLAQ